MQFDFHTEDGLEWFTPHVHPGYPQLEVADYLEGFYPQDAVWNPLNSLHEFADEEYDVEPATVMSLFKRAESNLEEFDLKVDCDLEDWKVIGFEAGDDRVDFSKNPLLLSLMFIIQEEVFKMKTSEFDTFISNRLYNFCEVTSTIPSALQESLEYAKKSSFRTLGFVDCPPLRLILDVKKGDGGHSSTEVGKATMLGIRRRDTHASIKLAMDIANFLQDGFLATHRMEEPKYLPVEMGGCGAPPDWGIYHNLYLYLKSFKRGTYDRVYGTATNEAYLVVRECDMGGSTEAIMANRLRQRQEYLWGTFAQHVLIPDKMKSGTMPPPLYKKVGIASGVSGVERRLVRAKLILPESQARVEWDREVRLSSVIMGITHISTALDKEKQIMFNCRKEYGGALSANSAFQNLMRKQATGHEVVELIRQGFARVSTGATHFTLHNARWIAEGCKGEIFSLADLPTSEDVYVRAEVSREKTMKIPGLSLIPQWRHKTHRVETVAKLGLWQISETMEQWANNKLDELLLMRDAYPEGMPTTIARDILRRNPEWVADDSMLIRMIYEDGVNDVSTTTVVLVTRDKRLCRQVAQTTNKMVIQLDPLSLAYGLGRRAYDANLEVTPNDIITLFERDFFPRNRVREPSRVYIDTGSMAAALRDMEYIDPVSYFLTTLSEVTENPRQSTYRRQYKHDVRVIPSKVQIHWPNTVSSSNPTFLGPQVSSPPTGSRNPMGRMKSMLKKYYH